AVRPAVYADAIAVHPRLRAQPLHALALVVDLHRALATVQRAAELAPAPRRAAVVEREHHVALLRQVLVEERVRTPRPGVEHRLRRRTAVHMHDHRVLAGRIE